MTAPIPFGISHGQIALVADGAYQNAFAGLAAQTARRLLCSLFIVDVSTARDRSLPIDDFLLTLTESAWRGVDTRLLIGGSRDNVALIDAAESGRARALALGISCRWLTSRDVRGSHAKLIVADDAVLTGSHNWSPGAVGGSDQTQDSVLVRSPDLAALLAARFEEQWQRAEEPHV